MIYKKFLVFAAIIQPGAVLPFDATSTLTHKRGRCDHSNISQLSRLSLRSHIAAIVPVTSPIAMDLKLLIQKEILSTKRRGLASIDSSKQRMDALLQQLENECPIQEPARSPFMEGTWIVQYTTAPPPSNGQLGPFKGIARQNIDLQTLSYVNHLSVPGNLSEEWLSANLSATFEEWDGMTLLDGDSTMVADYQTATMLDEVDSSRNRKQDFGANRWKVTFQKLTIRVWGLILFQKEFKRNTSRVWKMTYLDTDTRIGMLISFR